MHSTYFSNAENNKLAQTTQSAKGDGERSAKKIADWSRASSFEFQDTRPVSVSGFECLFASHLFLINTIFDDANERSHAARRKGMFTKIRQKVGEK